MQPPREVTPEELELDRKAWNLPRPVKRPETARAPSSEQSEHEDENELDTEAAEFAGGWSDPAVFDFAGT